MKKFLLLSLFLGVALAGWTLALAADPAPKAASHYDVLGTLVGGTWSGALPAMKPDDPPMHIEMEFARPANRQGIQFHATWFVGDKGRPYTNGFYAWDAAKKQFALYYTDSAGSLTQGAVVQNGNVFEHELTIAMANGAVEHARSRLTVVSPDVFTNEIFVQQDGKWTTLVVTRYERRK